MVMQTSEPLNDPLSASVSTDPIQLMAQIAERYIAGDGLSPVNPYHSPEELEAALDLAIREEGEPIERVMEMLEEVASVTPRSTSTGFCNQLFSGRDSVATAADMLAPVLNTSIYTFKAAGPMIIIEKLVIVRLAQKLGLSGDASNPEGVFTPGGSISNLVAMLIARNESVPGMRDDGPNGQRVTCYASRDAHYSVSKNAGILGIGRKNVRKIPIDTHGRLCLDELRNAIRVDLEAGAVPCCLIATAGTTVRGAFDPVEGMVDIAKEFGIWLHVDASFGGAVALSPAHRHLLDGVEHADSVAWNPHKVMGVPLSAAALITRQRGFLRKHLDESADYLFQGDDDEYNPGVRSIQCGRRNDALKVWAAWKHQGDVGYRDRIDHLMNLAQYAADQIRSNPKLTLACEPAFVNVCFEVNGKSSSAICDLLRERNELLVGHGEVEGRRIIRIPFVNGALTSQDIDRMLKLIVDAGDRL